MLRRLALAWERSSLRTAQAKFSPKRNADRKD